MSFKVAVTGVSTLLGENLLEILETREFPVTKLVLTDPGPVVGRSLMFAGHANRVISVSDASFDEIDLIFNCHPEGLPAHITPETLTGKLKVIDLCPAENLDCPCVVPEVNASDIASSSYLISPAPASVIASVALSALHKRYKILRVNMVSMSSVAEAGHKGVEALASETAKLLNGRDPEASFFGKQIAFNVIPFTGKLDDKAYSDNERFMTHQLHQLLGDEDIEIVSTAVQLPIFHGQNVVLHAECQYSIDQNEAQLLLDQTKGVRSIAGQDYTVVTDAAGQDEVFISRFRTELGNDSGFMLCAVSDSLRKGGALNAVQIAEHLFGLLDH